MGFIICKTCHETLPMPQASGPVEVGCPTCGTVNQWPPQGGHAAPFKKPAPETAPPPALEQERQQLPAKLVEMPCPACNKLTRGPVDAIGKMATCKPPKGCGHKFLWWPASVGFEALTIEARCSYYRQDSYDLIFQRPAGSTLRYKLMKTEHGSGALDRAALGNYDDLRQGGTVHYNRNPELLRIQSVDFSGHNCPYCGTERLSTCFNCGATMCQGGLDNGVLICPACAAQGSLDNYDPGQIVEVRRAVFTPRQKSLSGSDGKPALKHKEGQSVGSLGNDRLRIVRR